MTGRETLLIAALVLTATGAAGWTWAWQPLLADRAALRAELAEARTLAAALDAWPEGTEAPSPAPSTPLPARVTRSAEAAGIALARIERRGAGLSVTVEEVAFDTLIPWLAALESGGARLAAIEIDRRPLPGLVSARIDLEDTP
jgi:general secretion pathway protein M